MNITKCLACGNTELVPIIQLGMQPLANNYWETKTYPLGLNGCLVCTHSQLTYSVPAKRLFSRYLYESGTSQTLKDWFGEFADKLGTPKSILDIASNDGTFLRICKEKGWKVQGIDPAKNLAPSDIPTVVDFFSEFTRLDKFDVITAFNVVAHTVNPLGILKGMKENLADDGSIYIMTSQGDMLDNGQFDTIYHEHHSFFTRESMKVLARRAGLELLSCRVQDIHGGSLLFHLKPVGETIFERFASESNRVIEKARAFKPKYRMVAVGAAAKGVVFLNATKIEPEVVYDEAKLKWGFNIPGTQIPIKDFKELGEIDEPLTIIILAWNFGSELSAKIRALRPYKELGFRDEIITFFGED